MLLAVLLQLVFEFGLCLLDLHAPANWHGPFTAAPLAVPGAGGLLAARIDLRRPRALAVLGAAGPAGGLVVVGCSSSV